MSLGSLWLLNTTACNTNIVLTNTDNHVVDRSVSLPVYATSSLSDIRFNLDNVQSDLRCQTARTEGRYLTLIPTYTATPEEAMARLEAGDFRFSAYQRARETSVGFHDMNVWLSEMHPPNAPPLQLSPLVEGALYLVVLRSIDRSTPYRDRWISMALLEGSPDGDELVMLPDGCGLFDATADISPAGVSFRSPTYITWEELTQDAFGQELNPNDILSVEFAYFEGMSVTDLEENYLQLEAMADPHWSIETSKAGIYASEYPDIEPFDEGGTWVLSLTGYHDLPDFLTVLSR